MFRSLFMACPLFGMSAIGRFHCINEIKITNGKHPAKSRNLENKISENKFVATIINKYKNHPSIEIIKYEFPATVKLNIEAARVDQADKKQEV